MLIGEVSRRSGFSAKTLRYYEEIGVLDAPPRSASGYRQYDDTVLERLSFIRSAQALGLSLGEIRGIVTLRDDGVTPCGHVLDLLGAKSANIESAIRELRSLQAELKRLLMRARDLHPEDCDPNRVCHLIGPA